VPLGSLFRRGNEISLSAAHDLEMRPVNRLGAFGTQQLEIQRTAAEEHFVECVFNVSEQNAAIAVALEVELDRAPHQLFDEGRADFVRAAHDDLRDVVRDLRTARDASATLQLSSRIWMLTNCLTLCSGCAYDPVKAVARRAREWANRRHG
jgi:hypothetical protein